MGVAFSKAKTPSKGVSPRNVIAIRPSQLSKAIASMLVTVFGIVMPVRPLQPEKAPALILVTPSEIVMLVRLVQSRKA